MRKKKKSSKISKKRKKFSKEEVDFLLKINSIKLIYLDNALLGYKSDEEEKRICGDDFLNWVKNTKKESLISFINIYELRPLFIGKIIETHSHLAKDILKTLNDFDPLVMGEKETQKLFKKNKKLWNYLTKTLKISEQDSAHFVMAVSCEADLFVSFNKRAFQQNNKKIKNKLLQFGFKMPKVWTLKDIQKNMDIYKKINYTLK